MKERFILVLVTTRNQITLHVIDNFGTIRELA